MAVISALLIVTVVAVIAAQIVSRQAVFTRTVQAEQSRVQGGWLLRGALELSRQRLWQVRFEDPLTKLDQPWAQPVRVNAANARGDTFEFWIEDEQGKFNLRNLVRDGRVSMEEVASFERLCQMLGLNAALAHRIVQRVAESYVLLPDPVDDQPDVTGAFSSARITSPNASREPRAPRRPMLRVLGDLRNLKGIDDGILERLRPYVTILPANTWINGNTARAEVVAAHVPGLSLQQAQGLLVERDQGRWFINRGDFVNRLRMPDREMTSIRIGITSNWFLVHGQALSGERLVTLDALLHRNEEQRPRVIWSRTGA
ncbi:general secretion pathway protein K [Pseudomonas sp. BAY1663]|uniref:type II secretion system minor pseudopilin GspK n=1 Tax=Pseudomonas sp. BAY1663 TaxID=1439940 RepID=UPI00042DEF8A|nr:type II secretion system minor pseudopilin GspK [Pseudomonas sp. BAY1663]EXF47492.1 general secretion pathway protein K [Pseudomonas sp. BAY1663]